MKKLLVILFLLMPVLGFAQSKLYRGNSTLIVAMCFIPLKGVCQFLFL